MIAVRFQIGIFKLSTRKLVEANSGFALMDKNRLCLVSGIDEAIEECYVWNNLDDVIDIYVEQSRASGGIVVENTSLEDGRHHLKVDVAQLDQRLNLILEAVE